MATRAQAVKLVKESPYKVGRMIGFTKLTELHNSWLIEMICGTGDYSLMAHRNSYKTTCVSLALAMQIIVLPTRRTLFMRKTDQDIKEIVKQVKNILQDPHVQYLSQCIYGVPVRLVTATASEINTNYSIDPKGTAQLVGLGTGGSLTGKHFDRIFTDDIINLKDRISKAERDYTKLVYQELQNIKNRGGKIFNTLTPWHKEDAAILMPNPVKYDCYNTGIMTDEEIADKKSGLSPSLFAANYELRHIADENLLFTERPINADMSFIENAICHVDSAFYGEDYTALTAMTYVDGKFYTFGKMWRKHIQDCYTDILKIYNQYRFGKCFMERNADKGMVARDFRNLGIRTVTYDERMNKHIKIVTYLKAIWNRVEFVTETDPEYIAQILDYTEEAEHDDSADSMSVLARRLYKKAKIKLALNLNENIQEYES